MLDYIEWEYWALDLSIARASRMAVSQPRLPRLLMWRNRRRRACASHGTGIIAVASDDTIVNSMFRRFMLVSSCWSLRRYSRLPTHFP